MKKPFALALIVGWSLAVHLPGLTSPLLDYHAHRQCQTASMARDYYRRGMHFFKPETDAAGPPTWTGTEFPIYSYGLAILYKLFGFHEILGRLLSAGLTAWSAVFLYALVRRRLGETIGLWSALAMCAVPVHVYFTRTVQPESMALWAFIGFVFLLDRRLAGKGRFWDFPVIIALGAIGPLLKLPFLYLVGGLWLILGLETPAPSPSPTARGRGRPLGQPRYWLILLAILGLTAAWYRYAQQAPLQVLPLGMSEHWRNLRVIGRADFWEAHFVSRFPEIGATYTGLLLGILGAWRLYGNPSSRFFFGWWGITAAYTVLLGEYGWIHKYTEIPWAPVNGVFIAAGLAAAWRWAGAWTARRVWVALLVLGMPVHAALRIRHWYRLERLWLFDARQTLARISRPDDLVLTNTAETPVLLYYLDRNGYAVNLDKASPQEFDRLLVSVRFFVTPTEGSWSRHPSWSSFLESRARLIQEDPAYRIYEVRPPALRERN